MNLIYKHLWKKIKVIKEPNSNSSWLELFFDLIFVILFNNLINMGVNNFSLYTALSILSMCIFTLQIWLMVSMYLAIVDVYTWKIRISMFIQIILLIILNYALVNYLKNPTLFYIIWIFNMFNRILWLIPIRKQKASFMELISYILIQIALVTVVIIITNIWSFNSNIKQLIYAGVGIFIWILSFIKQIGSQNKTKLKLLEYMKERWGLITLIILAELLISSISGFNNTKSDFINILALIANLFYVFNVWTIYYDQISHIGIKKNCIQIWSSLHILLIFTLTIIGILTRMWIVNENRDLSLTWCWTIFNSLLFYLFAIIRYFSDFESDVVIKKYWNYQKLKQMRVNILLGTLNLVISPLIFIYLPVVFQFGLNTSILLLISNYFATKKYAQLIDQTTKIKSDKGAKIE